MNERYRYGYGDEPADRDNTFSRRGSMTDQRDEQASDTTAAGAEESPRGDADDEERRADQIREAAVTDPQTGTTTEADSAPVADAEETARPSTTTSVFEVEDEEEEEVTGRDTDERPPIAPAPPERTGDEASARTPASGPSDTVLADEPGSDATTVTPGTTSSGTATYKPPPLDTTDDLEATDVTDLETADTAKPEAVSPISGTPTTETPAAVSTGVDGLESEPAVQGSTGTETEMLVPGSGPAPVTAPVDDRSALLGSLDADGTRARFLDIQAGFVDEPRQAVQEAERFVDDLVQTLVRALETERSKLKATIDDGSTEDLRLALRGYRAFVDRLLNLTM
jgi:hypothetical protein